MKNIKTWIPEIMYEDDENGISSKIPFIAVPEKEIMPKMIFIFESRETGEYEPGATGDALPIVEMELHQYADMEILKKGMDETTYNKVRKCLGLEPLNEAISLGRTITENIRKNIKERI